jgi:spore germination protein YaaH
VHCGWIGGDMLQPGIDTFVANPDQFDVVHPIWFTLDDGGNPLPNQLVDNAQVIATAKAHQVGLVPLVWMGTVANVRTILASPQSIAAHVQQLVGLVTSHGYDGIDLDYEALWTAADRAPFSSLIAQTADALHALGKVLSLAVPAIDNGNTGNGYDYALLGQKADVVHIMGYDFHPLGAPHLGPLAPKGWIEAVTARVEQLGVAQHFVLGLANYGVGNGWYTSAGESVTLCGGTYATATDHMLTCSLANQPWEAGRAPHCTSSKGELWFEDAASVGEKALLAKNHGLRGIAYYTMGNEPPGYLAAINAIFP